MASPGGGGSSTTTGQPSCTTVSLGKYVRRALRAASGKKKPKKKKQPIKESVSSMELMSSFQSDAGTAALAARKESVVRVVLRSGVVEVYPGVVQACTVIRKHPPGLCLAHPDVFRNPHGAVVRPLEPLFPGQKFLLLPESTVIRLKQKIPESSIGAPYIVDDDDEEEEASEDDNSSDDNNGTASTASSSEEAGSEESGYFMAGCSAREFYVANDRWSHCQFKNQKQSPPTNHPDRSYNGGRATSKKKMKGNNKKRRKTGRDRRVAAPVGLRSSLSSTMAVRAWEPSLPSVEEEEEEQEEACFDSRRLRSSLSSTMAVSELPSLLL